MLLKNLRKFNQIVFYKKINIKNKKIKKHRILN